VVLELCSSITRLVLALAFGPLLAVTGAASIMGGRDRLLAIVMEPVVADE
jgi:hypothetical protein